MSSSAKSRIQAPPGREELFVEQRIRQTRRQLKLVDLSAGLLMLGIATLAYLLAAALIDHWIVPGGMGFWGRLLLMLGLLGFLGVYFARLLLPAILGKVNPIFAAQMIEQGQPTLKNSLVNFLLLRGERSRLAPAIYQNLEHRAATDLIAVRAELAVDRGHVVRLGYVLAAILAVCCLYLILSPKNPLQSAARVIWPWANIEAPTRVTIEEIEPGDMFGEQSAFYGDWTTVSARIRGLKQGESASVVYSTADGQVVDQAVPMEIGEDGYRHEAKLPPGELGLQQGIDYRLVAGDARTRRFNVEVQTAPAIVVETVDYNYPDYTGIPNHSIDRQGDVRAVEGTKVTLHATANRPIARAEIDLDCDGRQGLKMLADQTRATGTFTLRLKDDGTSLPEHDCYQLRFTDENRRTNRRPTRHRIEVIRDLPPTVELVEPKEDDVELPADSRLMIRVRAEDPDFGLRHVVVQTEVAGEPLPIEPLLKKVHEGPWEAEYAFVPARLGLKPGDRVIYWIEAIDNKLPEPNKAETSRRRIRILGNGVPPQAEPSGQFGEEGQPGQGDQQQEPPEAGRPGEPLPPEGETPDSQPSQAQDQPQEGQSNQDDPQAEPPEQQQQNQPSEPDQGESQEQPGQGQESSSSQQQGQGEQGQGEQGQGEQGAEGQQSDEQPSKPIDPEAQDGDAFEEILKHRQQQEQQPNPRQQPGQQQGQPQPGQPKPDQQPQDGQQKPQQQPSENQQGQPQEGHQIQPQQGDHQQPGDPRSDRRQPSDQNQGQPTGQKPQDQPKQPGDQQQPGTQSGEPNQSDPSDPSGKQPPGGQQPPGDSSQQPSQGEPQSADQPQSGQAQDTDQKPQPGDPEHTGPQPPSTGQSQPGQPSEPGQKPSGSEPQPGESSSEQGQPTDARPGQKPPEPTRQAGDRQGQRQPGNPQQKPGEPRPSGGTPEQPNPSPGAGQRSQQPGGSPKPQEGNQPREKKPGGSAEQTSQQDPAQSPSHSPKQSDSQSDTAGDRSGGGKKGGGQQSKQEGTGSPGSNTESEDGAAAGQQPGEGETGRQAGDQVESDRPTGNSAQREGGRAGESQDRPDQQPGRQSQGPDSTASPQETRQQPSDQSQSGQGSKPDSGQRGRGAPGTGGQPDQEAGDAPQSAPPREPGGDAPNLEYANEATDLALEHLRDQMQQDDSELLDKLGWSREDAQRFLKRWEQMKQSARNVDTPSAGEKKQLDEALKSLGLRPRGTELRRGSTPSERVRGTRESRQAPVPSEWSELFRAYSRGVAGNDQ